MRIECPSCRAAYEVPDHMITGKTVRCAHCGTDWAPAAQATPPSPATPIIQVPIVPAPAVKPFLAAPDPALALRPVAATIRKPTPRRGLLITAWVVTVVLIGAVIAVAYNRREAVMNAWPPSQRLYAWVGLH